MEIKESYRMSFKLLKNYKWNSLFFKYWIILCVVILLPVIFLCAVIYTSYNNSITENVKKATQEKYLEVDNKYKNILDDINRSYLDIFELDCTMIFLNRIEKDEVYKFQSNDTVSELSDIIIKTIATYSFLDSIYIHSQKNDYILTNRGNMFKKDMRDTIFEQDDDYRDELMCITPVRKNPENKYVITVIFNIYNNGIKTGRIYYNIDVNKLCENMGINYKNQNDYFTIAYNDNTIIYTNDNKLNNTFENYYNNKHYIVYDKKNSDYSSRVIVAYNLDELSKSFRNVRWQVLIIIFVIIILLLIISFYLSIQFYSSISNIVYYIDNPKDIDNKENNELQYINKNIFEIVSSNKNFENEMVHKIAMLKKAQHMALQTQINPHFIFNTLGLVSVMIFSMKKGPSEAERVVSLLCETLRYSLDTKSHIVPVRSELNSALKYIEIERIKYKNSFDFEINKDDSLLDCNTIKFILQPIIENAFEHGLNNLNDDRKGKIIIDIYRENKDICYRITDNGYGMGKEKLKEIREKLATDDLPESISIGLCNVNQRIKITFGEKCGVSIDSDNSGTCVIIKHPIYTDDVG